MKTIARFAFSLIVLVALMALFAACAPQKLTLNGSVGYDTTSPTAVAGQSTEKQAVDPTAMPAAVTPVVINITMDNSNNNVAVAKAGSTGTGSGAAASQPQAESVATAQATIVANQPAPEPQITPDNTKEVSCQHINAGKFDLQPGFSANGGHIWVNGKEYLNVDDKVVVVTNNSSKPVSINSTDGVGVCNDTDYDRQVIMRFSEGCDSNGCSQVLWVNVTDKGVEAKKVNKPQ